MPGRVCRAVLALGLGIQVVALTPIPGIAQAAGLQSTRRLVNVDRNGLALQGYDPVAFFRLGTALKGVPTFRSTHLGATYLFASAEHKSLFDEDPDRYEPAYGGYCAYGVSQGGLFEVDVATAQILGGRLILNKNPRVRELFDRDPQGRLRLAEKEWPGLVAKHGEARP